MFKYAQLNNENMVIGISQLSGEVVADNMILINDLVVEQGSSYSRTTGEFTPPIPQPIPEPQPTLEEKLARMEQQLEEQGLVQLEVLATIYEELLMKG